MEKGAFAGVLVPVLTPFHDDLAPDRRRWVALCRALLDDWRSDTPADPQSAGDWLAEMFPMRDRHLRKHIRACLANAGMR